MAEGRVFRRITYLGLAIEQGTEGVPDDGRFYVTEHGRVRESCASLTIAEAMLEMAEEDMLAADPKLKNPRDRINKERAFNDIISARGASRAAARSKAQGKGGRGGRGGV